MERTRLRADDGRGLGLHHQAAQRQLEAPVVARVHVAEATDLPGVERGEGDGVLLEV